MAYSGLTNVYGVSQNQVSFLATDQPRMESQNLRPWEILSDPLIVTRAGKTKRSKEATLSSKLMGHLTATQTVSWGKSSDQWLTKQRKT